MLNEWARGFKDRDGKFVKEFQTTFDSSFWELYLFAVVKQFHLEVDFSFTSPDFFITNHGGTNVEATVASHAQGSSPEHAQSGAPIPADLNEFNRQTIIRISNSIDAKRRKYMESYSGLSNASGMTESNWSSDDGTSNPPSRKLQKVLPHDNFDDRGICAAPQSVAARLDIGGENGLRDRNQNYQEGARSQTTRFSQGSWHIVKLFVFGGIRETRAEYRSFESAREGTKGSQLRCFLFGKKQAMMNLKQLISIKLWNYSTDGYQCALR